jgi:hypothetical protein
MAYTSATLSLQTQGGGPIGLNIWSYDTIDATGDIDQAGYITDARVKGMAKGDLVVARIWTTAVPTSSAQLQTAAATASVLSAMGIYIVMGMSTAGAADLSAVLALTVTNSD